MSVLEIDDVHASYGAHRVLCGVTLQVPRGKWFCLLGPNGAGKTTLLHCIAGRLQTAHGDIRIAGQSLSSAPVEAKRRLGYACAPEQLPGLLTGRQCLEVYAIAKELESIDSDVLELSGALGFAPYIDAFVDTYSLGTRQKLCVLLSLLGNPDLILLDEVFNGLDPRSAFTLKGHLRARVEARRSSILLATHSLDIVERHADDAGLLMEGRIAATWGSDQIRSLVASGENAFEKAVAAATDAD